MATLQKTVGLRWLLLGGVSVWGIELIAWAFDKGVIHSLRLRHASASHRNICLCCIMSKSVDVSVDAYSAAMAAALMSY